MDGILFHTKGLKHVPSGQLERWYGVEAMQRVSGSMRKFPFPAPLLDCPGRVFAMPGGDFVGNLKAGSEMSALDRAADALRRYRRAAKARGLQHGRLNAFASLDALIAAATGGKAQYLNFAETGIAVTAIGSSAELWTRGPQPVAGSAGAAAPGGTATTNASTGNWGYSNPSNANTGHYLAIEVTASVINNSLALIDQLLRVAKTMNSTATEAVTGTFSRYQSATATSADYIGGNFCYPAVPTTILPATAHNWTVCQYTDQAGNTANSFPSATGVSACAVGQIDLAAGQNSWFMPLASGDVGVKALTQMQCSALVATGTIDFVVAHLIGLVGCPIANQVCVGDALYTALQLTSVFDNACLTALEMPKPATTATSYSGRVTLVSE